MKRLLLAMGMVVSGVGCTVDPVDIGDDGAAGSGAEGGVIRTWEGTFEQRDEPLLPSGSDRVRLEQHDDGTFVFVFGVGDPPPPATDPNVGYPENLAWASMGPVARLFPIEGYRYVSSTTSLDDEKLHYENLQIYDLWADWCAMQTGRDDTSDFDSCDAGGNGGGGVSEDGCFVFVSPGGVETSPVDCGKLMLCDMSPVCECSAEGCQVGIGAVRGDLLRAGPRLDGELGYLGSLYQVTLHLLEQ